MIGSLLYLTASRPDISFSVGACAHYQASPKESHLLAVKRIIKYVNGTVGYVVWFSIDTTAEISGFSNVDWAGCANDRKITAAGLAEEAEFDATTAGGEADAVPPRAFRDQLQHFEDAMT
ncbi:uncharacterized protein LOC114321575 [Camellia sinensis]|uniref:uncharacterized protein LOC114321575 n=1 Tax=Camellia sinensis TaxID=4442 RepID=UPI0010358ECF|nr:uncharacterized protein LOC114321575 [Camellia sinensis]